MKKTCSLFLWLFWVISAYAVECDCSRHIGVCQGTASVEDYKSKIDSFGNIHHSFQLHIEVTNAPACSDVKFTYNLHGAKGIVGIPEYAVIFNGRFNKPVTMINDAKSFSLEELSCQICLSRGTATRPQPESPTERPLAFSTKNPFAGRWVGFTTSMFGQNGAEFEISFQGDLVSGYYRNTSGNLPPMQLFDGHLQGNKLLVKATSRDGPIQWNLNLTSPVSINGTWKSGLFFNGSVSIQKQGD